MEQLLSRSWWMLALRGAAALLLGISALAWPGITLLVLVSLFAAFALLAGAASIAGAVRNRATDRGWWLLLVVGVAGLGAGVAAMFQPGATLFALILLMAAYAVATGVLDIAVAIRLRKAPDHEGHEWLLILAGMVSILFGVLVVLFPPAGALALAFCVSLYATATGILLLALALRARRWQKHALAHGGLRDAGAHS